jgi:CRP-like cAMP-binding protein
VKTYKEGIELGDFFEKFKTLPFLESFSEKYLKEILRSSQMVMYQSNEMIIQEGSYDKRLYVLFNGKVKVVKNDKVVAIFDDPGEVFGELQMVTNENRSASVYAIGMTLCLVIDTTFLKNLSAEDRNACIALFYGLFLKIMAGRLTETTEQLSRARRRLEKLEQQL